MMVSDRITGPMAWAEVWSGTRLTVVVSPREWPMPGVSGEHPSCKGSGWRSLRGRNDENHEKSHPTTDLH